MGEYQSDDLGQVDAAAAAEADDDLGAAAASDVHSLRHLPERELGGGIVEHPGGDSGGSQAIDQLAQMRAVGQPRVGDDQGLPAVGAYQFRHHTALTDPEHDRPRATQHTGGQHRRGLASS